MQVPAPDAARHAAVNPWVETSPTPVTQTQQQGCQRRPGPPAAPWAASGALGRQGYGVALAAGLAVDCPHVPTMLV